MKIEKYSKNNYDEVVDLLIDLQNYFIDIDSFNERVSFSSKNEARLLLKQILEDVDKMDGVLFTAKFNNKIVGFVQGVINNHEDEIMHNLTYKPSKDGWIGFLFVEKEFRGKQIGKALINAMKEFFKEKKCNTMRLIVSSDNYHTIKIYEKYGFKPTDLKMSMNL